MNDLLLLMTKTAKSKKKIGSILRHKGHTNVFASLPFLYEIFFFKKESNGCIL